MLYVLLTPDKAEFYLSKDCYNSTLSSMNNHIKLESKIEKGGIFCNRYYSKLVACPNA